MAHGLFTDSEREQMQAEEVRAVNAHHEELKSNFIDALRRGNDVKLPHYISTNKVNFWTVSSMLTGAGNDAAELLFRACYQAQNGMNELAIKTLDEFVGKVATEYADDNAEELALRCMP